MKWISRIQIIIGIWILISPWLLGFSSFSLARWSNVIVGAVTAILGLWGMFGEEE